MTARRVGILAACADPQLFGLSLWPRQREMLAQVEAGPRIHVWACGRRSGKTMMAAIVSAHSALFRPDLDAMVRPGESRYCVIVATNLRQARIALAAARSIIEGSPLLAGEIASATEDELRLANGCVIAAFPCSSRGARGWPISTLLLDELAHFQSETEGPAVADRVYEALVPATAQFGAEARILAASTPYGTDGLFAQLYQRADSGEMPSALAVHAATADVNPTISQDVLAEEQARSPESFRAEYLAEFVGSGASFFDDDQIDDAIADRAELEPAQAVGWVAGLDPAFSSDPFGLALVGRDLIDRRRLRLGVSRSWLPRRFQIAEERRGREDELLDEVAEVCLRYSARVVTDQAVAPLVLDRLRKKGLSVRVVPMTATSKTAVFSALRARLYARSLELYPHADLQAELRRVRVQYRANQSGIVNPRVGKSHGDLAQALAMAVHEIDLSGVPGKGIWQQGDQMPAITAGVMERDF